MEDWFKRQISPLVKYRQNQNQNHDKFGKEYGFKLEIVTISYFGYIYTIQTAMLRVVKP